MQYWHAVNWPFLASKSKAKPTKPDPTAVQGFVGLQLCRVSPRAALTHGQWGHVGAASALPKVVWDQSILPRVIWDPNILPGVIWDPNILPGVIWDPNILPEVVGDPNILPGVIGDPNILPRVIWDPNILPGVVGDPKILPRFIQDLRPPISRQQWDRGAVGNWDMGAVGRWGFGAVGFWGGGVLGRWAHVPAQHSAEGGRWGCAVPDGTPSSAGNGAAALGGLTAAPWAANRAGGLPPSWNPLGVPFHPHPPPHSPFSPRWSPAPLLTASTPNEGRRGAGSPKAGGLWGADPPPPPLLLLLPLLCPPPAVGRVLK